MSPAPPPSSIASCTTEIITMTGRSYRLRNQAGQVSTSEDKTKAQEKPAKDAKPSRRTAETATA
jgi:hypothetical protein